MQARTFARVAGVLYIVSADHPPNLEASAFDGG
jgi:hypothetical protein